MIGRKPEEWPKIPKENQERASVLGTKGRGSFKEETERQQCLMVLRN